MKITDKEVIRALEHVRSAELWEMLDSYPEDEVDGRTDWEMVANEAGWLLDSYNSDDTVRHDDLMECKRIYGRLIAKNRKGVEWSTRDYINWSNARDTINEYNRLSGFVKKLKAKGLYCPYC